MATQPFQFGGVVPLWSFVAYSILWVWAAIRRIRQLFRRDIGQLSMDFADFERVKMFTLLDREFTQEADEMTPTLKLKRKIILEKYKDQIEKMYGD